MQSRAPEYRGSPDLPPPSNPKTLTPVAGDSAALPTAAPSSTPAPSSSGVVVPRLPGTPELSNDGLYVFTGGGLELAVEPHSGNAVRFALDGKNALLPPPTDLDLFSAEVEGSSLALKSPTGSLVKRYRLDTARRSVEVTYTLTNASPKALRVSAPDFQRVPTAGGLTFFPGAKALLPGSTLKLDVWQPVVWFAHDQSRDTTSVEARVDGTEGWVASVNDSLLLVKTFSDSGKPTVVISVPYDAATKQHPWVEIGGQSDAFELPAGASITSNVRLFLRKLPPSVAAKPGNRELVGFVRGVIQ